MSTSGFDRPDLQALFARAVQDFLSWRAHGHLAEPLRYALMGQGKRVRPMVAMLIAEGLGKKPESALTAALAVELVHTYSLIHDDLPQMDDDDMRRGRPTLHKKFDEATALLVGDALQAEAYLVLSEEAAQSLKTTFDASASVAMVAELAHASGVRGMVEGQALDLYWTARQGATHEALDELHGKKTGALLGAAAAMGAIAAGAPKETVEICRLFGARIGLAFQIIDDLLDDSDATGKTKGKDKDAQKLTYVATMTREQAQAHADELTQRAMSDLAGVLAHSDDMMAFARWLLHRRS